jgi:heme oxygenase
MSAHATVRVRTVGDHAMIDAAFSCLDLSDRADYLHFLRAHAGVLPAIEAALGVEPSLPPWRPRTDALKWDLIAFGSDLPELCSIGAAGLAEKFGLLYVIEGSRLGARLLLPRVGTGYSSHYLSALHQPGEWRAFIQALDGRAAREGTAWLEGVVAGARHGFRLYGKSLAKALVPQHQTF